MTDRYEKIRTALEMGPTPGEWYWSDAYPTQDGRKTWSLIGDGGFGILSCDGDENSPQSVNLADAELIAACDPDTIRALLEERDALREALKVLVCWIPSADTYRRWGFNPETPMRAYEAARAALRRGQGSAGEMAD